jgi:hypothetical protein
MPEQGSTPPTVETVPRVGPVHKVTAGYVGGDVYVVRCNVCGVLGEHALSLAACEHVQRHERATDDARHDALTTLTEWERGQ